MADIIWWISDKLTAGKYDSDVAEKTGDDYRVDYYMN